MKHSVTSTVSRRVSIILIIMFLILLIGSFFYISYNIFTRSKNYSFAISGLYTDIAIHDADKKDVPFDVENNNIPELYGKYVCKWYDTDYAFMYKPNFEDGTVTYISFCESEEVKDNKSVDLSGKTVKHTMSEKELEVWNNLGSYDFALIDLGKLQLSSIISVQDEFGNKVMAGVGYSSERIAAQVFKTLISVGILIACVILLIYFSVNLIVRRKVAKPIRVISQSMQEFITDGKRSKKNLDIGKTGEFVMIADAFNNMTEEIDSYIENIEKLTSEKAHQQAQLDIAGKIQKGFLQKEYLGAVNYDIRAIMKPARDIGGDLFDYMPLDSHRVLVVIADVSGKGITAAIFMAVTMMLIRQYAKLDLSPSEIMEKTNSTLSGNNAAFLFATAFVGIYDSRTKTITYSNAGHNLPYIVSSDKVKRVDAPAGTVLGYFENEKYTESKITLQTGDTFFLYTDGVTESVNTDKKFFGTERLEKTLEEFGSSDSDNVVSFVTEAVSAFSSGAEQFDDITVITLTAREGRELVLSPELSEFERIKTEILSLEIPKAQKMSLCLAAEEWFVNICMYAFEGMAKENEKIRFSLTLTDEIKMKFEHGGIPFNPIEESSVDIEEYDIDTAIGGLGNFIAFASVDEVKYEYIDNKNILTFIEKIKEDIK